MAKADGTIYVDTEIGTEGFKAGAKEIESLSKGMANKIEGIGNTAKKVGGIIAAAFAITKLVQFGKECLELGSDLEEVQNVVDVTFTTMSDKVNEFAKNAMASGGLSETMAKQYVGTFGAMSKSFGFTEAEAYNMSTALTQLAGDVASFYNISQDLAYIKLKSVFTGETETLKDLGVVMTQNALDAYAMASGYGKTTAAMTEQEKVALRLRFVQDQLSAASGDFIRTSDSWANQVRIMQLQIQSLKATIGQGLINLFTPIIKVINIVLSKLTTLANAFKSFTALITGKKASAGGGGSGGGVLPSGGELADTVGGYEDAAGAVNDLAKSAGKAAKATKEAQKANEGYLSGLDEVRKFETARDTADTGGSGAGGGVGGAGIDFDELAEGETVLDDINESTSALLEKLKELRDIFMQGFWDGLGDFQYRLDIIRDGLESIKNSLIDIWTDPAVQAAADNWINSVAYLLGSFAGSVASIGLTIAANLVGGLAMYLEQNKDRIKGYLISMFDIWAEINNMLSELFQSIAYVFEAFASENGQRLTANLIGIVTDAFMGATELISKLVRDILNIFIQPFVDNKEELRTALEGFLGVLADVTGTIKDGIDDTFDKLNEVYDEHFKPLFDAIAEGLSDLLGEFLEFWNGNVQPILEDFAAAFDDAWKNYIQPAINGMIEFIGFLADCIRENLEPLTSIIVSFFAAWETVKFLAFIQMAGGIAGAMATIKNAVLGVAAAVKAGTIAKLADKAATMEIYALYAKDFLVSLVQTTAALVKQAAQFAINTAAKIADTAAQVAMTAATVAWNAVCALATAATTALGAAIAFLTSPIGIAIAAIAAIIAIGVLLYKNWDTVKQKASEIWGQITNIFTRTKEAIGRIIDGIKEFFQGWIDFLVGIFTGDLDRAIGGITGIFQGLKDFVGGIIDAILGFIGDLISGITDAIKGIDKLESKIDGVSSRNVGNIVDIGLQNVPFSASLLPPQVEPKVPYLASGAVIPPNAPFMAMLGDQRNGKNLEAPESLIRRIVREEAGGNNQGGTSIVKLYLDSKQVAEAVIKQGKVQQMSTGRNPFAFE